MNSRILISGLVCLMVLWTGCVQEMEKTTTTVEMTTIVSTTIDVSRCEGIEYQWLKDQCYYLTARSNKDFSLCKKIITPNTKQACEAVEKQDPDICGKIEDRNDLIDGCYIEVARVKQDPEVCSRVKSQKWRNFCYGFVASLKQNPGICEKIEDQDPTDSCYRDIAKAKQDVSLCDKVESEGNREWCYYDIAKAKQDISLCEKIEKQERRDLCEAVTKQDISLCEGLEGQFWKRVCYNDLNQSS